MSNDKLFKSVKLIHHEPQRYAMKESRKLAANTSIEDFRRKTKRLFFFHYEPFLQKIPEAHILLLYLYFNVLWYISLQIVSSKPLHCSYKSEMKK